MAAATSPRITDGEILSLANSKTVNAEVLRYIYTNREFLRTYAIRESLVKNPKVPLPTALKLMQTLQEKDIKDLARDRNVPQTIQAQAKAYVMKKEQAAKAPAGGKH
jgi:ABC-type lipopolysaccharide export system ATPase subunit